MNNKIVGDFLYEKESYEIRGACFEVWKNFDGGFKEKIIDKSLKRELEIRGLQVESQKRIDVYYRGIKVGSYIPDFVINNKILVELKVKPYLAKEDEKQFWRYLRGSDYKLGFLINFGSKELEIKRRIYDKARKDKQSASVNQRLNQHFSASKTKGFTIVEVIVVVAITMMITAIFLGYSGSNRSQLTLSIEQAKIAQLILRARSLAVSTYAETTPPCGYGFGRITSALQTFYLFRYNVPNSAQYAAGYRCDPETNSGAALKNLNTSQRTIIESYTLPRNIIYDATLSTLSSVLFIPPAPRARLFTFSPPIIQLPLSGSGRITIRTSDGARSATININEGGQISF